MTAHTSDTPEPDLAATAPVRPTLMRRLWRRLRWPVGSVLALLVLLLGGVGWALPAWLKPRLEAEGQAWLGTPVAIQALAVRPLALEVELTGLRIGTPEAPLFTLGGLLVDVAGESLWRLTPVVSRLSVREPQVVVSRAAAAASASAPAGAASAAAADDGYNFSPVLAHLRARLAALPPKPPEPEGSHKAPPPFELHQLHLSGGQIRYDDARLAQHHRVEQLDLSLPLISSLAADVARPVLPRLSARIDGSLFALDAQARPFAPGRPAELALQWQGYALAPWADLLRAVLPPALAPQDLAGSLDVKLALSFSSGAPTGAGTTTTAASAASASTFASTSASASASAAPTSSASSAVARPASATPAAAEAAASAPAPASGPTQLVIRGEIALKDFHILLPGQGAELGFKALRLEALDLAPLQNRYAAQRLLFDALDGRYTRRAAPMAAAASAAGSAPAPASASATATTADAPATPAAAVRLPTVQLGVLACQACRFTVTDAQARPPVQFTLAPLELSVRQISADLSQPLAVLLDTGIAAATRGNASGHKATAETAPGRLHLDSRVSLLDAAGAPSALGRPGTRLAVTGALDLAGLDLRLAQSYLAPFLNMELQSGRFSTAGELDLLLALDKAPGTAAAPAPAAATLGPSAASVATGPVATASLPRVAYRGRLSVDTLRSYIGRAGDELLAWRTLGLDGMELAWQPVQLQADLGRITLDGLRGRVIVLPGGTLNLANIVKRDPAAQAAEAAAAAASAPASAGAGWAAASVPAQAPAHAPAPTPATSSSGRPPVLSWQQIQLSDGAVYFTDRNIRPGFSAYLGQLAGSISAVSSLRPEPAKVELSGAVDGVAPLRIAGRVHPLGVRAYTDIDASARGIPLSRLSSYAERYAGYAIDKGSLSVAVHYKIDQGRLEADNQLFLDQLTFGKESGSADATKLPVRLAVALLSNRRGEIDIRMPVAGTLDDPQFSIGGVIWRVFVNLVGKAITAPFALLMGDGDADHGQVDFAPGSSELDDTGRRRLDALADKLLDRPALKLEATGQADPARDAAELQRVQSEAAAAARLAAAAAAAQAGGAAQVATSASASASAHPGARRAAPSAASAAAGLATPASGPAAAPQPQVDLPSALSPTELQAALRELADRRAEHVLAYLAARLPIERVGLVRSQVGDGALQGEAALAARVGLRVY
ncbi:MAG: hypothetical protein RIQ60_4102 [Pseudomonadota bacterium]|jgi:hypothetical protein